MLCADQSDRAGHMIEAAGLRRQAVRSLRCRQRPTRILIPPLGREPMRIHVGCEMTYEFPQPTPVIATLNVHATRFSDLERPDYLITTPAVPLDGYRDSFGNWCNRMVAPAGRFTLKTDRVVRDHGSGDVFDFAVQEIAVDPPSPDAAQLLLGSR